MVGDYVEELNTRLNRWETIKKWEILDHDLTIESGELTPSMKVKRNVVEDNNKAADRLVLRLRRTLRPVTPTAQGSAQRAGLEWVSAGRNPPAPILLLREDRHGPRPRRRAATTTTWGSRTTCRARRAGHDGTRGVLALVGGLGAAGLVACANQDSDATTLSSNARGTNDGAQGAGPGGAPPAGGGADSSVSAADGEIPEETAGPYPGDGSNDVDVLTETGIVRSDITSASATPSGSPRASR